MNNPVTWDQVKNLTEGLVMVAGWSGGRNDDGLTAELLMFEDDVLEVTFVVSEFPELLELVVNLTINFPKDTKEELFQSTLRLLSKIIVDESLPQSLKLATWHSKSVVYEFTYPWRCDSELQQEITLPVLHATLERWAPSMSLPALAMAPLLRRYIQGKYKRDDDFVSAVKDGFRMISLEAKGRA